LPARSENLIVSYSGLLGGSERILLDLVPALGSGAVVACPPGRLSAALEAAGIDWEPIKERPLEVRASTGDRLRAGGRLTGHAAEVHRLVRALRPRRVVAWGMPSVIAASLGVAASRPRPELVFQHVDLLPTGPLAVAVRRAARRCRRVVALSEAIAADLAGSGPLGERIAVVHPGVDLARFEPLPPGAGPPRVLLLGAIVGWKRPDLALEAVARAARELDGLTLDVVGEPFDRAGEGLLEELRRRAAAPDLDGSVRFRGRLDDPRAVLAEASCLLHCADREPFGMVLVEALAASRPVVAPAGGGPPEIVDESCGRLYPPGDAAAAAAALTELLRAPAAELAAAARRRAERHFGLDAARERWVRAL
jgi:glycosyltransferase involved in cell wall biosynthesis